MAFNDLLKGIWSAVVEKGHSVTFSTHIIWNFVQILYIYSIIPLGYGHILGRAGYLGSFKMYSIVHTALWDTSTTVNKIITDNYRDASLLSDVTLHVQKQLESHIFSPFLLFNNFKFLLIPLALIVLTPALSLCVTFDVFLFVF